MKISTILIGLGAIYVANFFYQRYRSLEREVKELRTKCDNNVSKSIVTSPKIDDAIQGITGNLIQGLSSIQSMMLKNT